MDKFRKIYKDLFKENKINFVQLMKNIVTKLETNKNNKYIRNKKYDIEEYITGIIEVISNNTSWRKYNGTIDGKILNNKHNYFIKLGVYEELYKVNLKKYLKKNKRSTKELSMDSSFVQNKYGKEKLGRNIYYKNKRGRKITTIVDNKGIPLKVDITEGNRHDAKIALKVLKELPTNKTKEEKYILADKGYDSKKIREIIKSKKYKPIISKRRYKNRKNRSLKKNEIKRYRKRIIVENFVAWIKMYPKIDKIYEKSLKSYKGLLLLAISIIIYKRN